MPTVIDEERPDSADAAALITELEAHLDPLYPKESQHGLDVEQLIHEEVAFFVIRHDNLPAGCGGVKLFGAEYGEVKRMYVRPEFRGLGLGKAMLAYLAEFARNSGVPILRLETGIHQAEAIALYERFGFRRIPPFGDYWDDPLSVYFEMQV